MTNDEIDKLVARALEQLSKQTGRALSLAEEDRAIFRAGMLAAARIVAKLMPYAGVGYAGDLCNAEASIRAAEEDK